MLPAESRVLEAGCALAGRVFVLAQVRQITVDAHGLLDRSLACAKRTLAEHRLSADFVCEDVFVPGQPDYDLVFNAGALANYAFDEQVAFLRGMASRSRKYVLALAPNPMCYWYWVWRMQRSSQGDWPFGAETPVTDLAATFEAAGLRFLGQTYGDGDWSESFIRTLDGLDDWLREEILAIHRSSAIPEQWRSSLVIGLGCKGEAPQIPALLAQKFRIAGFFRQPIDCLACRCAGRVPGGGTAAQTAR